LDVLEKLEGAKALFNLVLAHRRPIETGYLKPQATWSDGMDE